MNTPRPRILDLATCPGRRVLIRLISTAATPPPELEEAGLRPDDRYVGVPGAWHFSRPRRRWFPCRGAGRCLPCRNRGLRRRVRFELIVLVEGPAGTREERRIYLSPTASKEFARLAAEIEGASADPRERPIEWKEVRS